MQRAGTPDGGGPVPRASSFSIQEPAMDHAIGVVRDISAGRAVGAEQFSHARQALVDAAWEADSATPVAMAAVSGLALLAGAASYGREQARLLGEAVALGAPGEPVLEAAAAAAPNTALGDSLGSPDFDRLRDCLTQEPAQRLRRVTDMLAKSGATHPQRSDAPQPTRLKALRDADHRSRRLGTDDLLTTPDYLPREGPEPDSETLRAIAAALDRATQAGFPPGTATRQAATPQPTPTTAPWADTPVAALRECMQGFLAMGQEAITPLVQLLRQPAPGKREFAAASLINLGSTPDMARAVCNVMLTLGADPSARPQAEYVQASVETATGLREPDAAGARRRSRAAGLGDGWLRRAVAACDAPNILCAAAGRETLAIPLVVARLVEAREPDPRMVPEEGQ